MEAINGARTPQQTTSAPADTAIKTTDGKTIGTPTANRSYAVAGTADTAHISSLAQMLSEASVRAAARDASSDRAGLAAIANHAKQPFFSPLYENTKATRDMQLPTSEDPQRLEQARQATEFLNGKGPNPFKSLSLEQLTLITYDEAFTVNERRAAWEASYDEREAWSKAVSKQLMDEYNRDGHFSPDTLRGILDYYKKLPAMLEAQLPATYEADINKTIQIAEREEAQGKDQLQALLDSLTMRGQSEKNELPERED